MKRIYSIKLKLAFLLVCAMGFFSSCLKAGLEEIENSNLCEITSITFEYRWLSQNANWYDVLNRQQLTLSNNVPDKDNRIDFIITVPAANNSGEFKTAVRNTVSLDRLYLTSIISPAAKITPLDDAPAMGTPASFEIGKEYKYQVTAANGATKTFVLCIVDFIK